MTYYQADENEISNPIPFRVNTLLQPLIQRKPDSTPYMSISRYLLLQYVRQLNVLCLQHIDYIPKSSTGRRFRKLATVNERLIQDPLMLEADQRDTRRAAVGRSPGSGTTRGDYIEFGMSKPSVGTHYALPSKGRVPGRDPFLNVPPGSEKMERDDIHFGAKGGGRPDPRELKPPVARTQLTSLTLSAALPHRRTSIPNKHRSHATHPPSLHGWVFESVKRPCG